MTGITDLNTAAQTSCLSFQYARTSGNTSSPKAGTLSPQPFDTFEQSGEPKEEEMVYGAFMSFVRFYPLLIKSKRITYREGACYEES